MEVKMEDMKTEHNYKQEGNKFIMQDTTTLKIVKTQKLQNVFLADGKSVLSCAENLLEGEESCDIVDMGDYYEQTIKTVVRFAPNYLLRWATSVRQQRDILKPQKENFEYFEKELKDLEPLIKSAGEENKKVEKLLETAAEENNELMK